MSNLTYADVVHELFPRLTGGIRWGLERIERLLADAGHPERRFPSIHIGGTNGKGSVSATIESVLRTSGLRTALYTSPHLCTFRERIVINGQPINENELVAVAEKLWPSFTDVQPSFFEATTALAFRAFADAKVDVAVVEVGLGGRLDATNVVMPLVSVLTNVALDHAQYLGNTLESIAREKAGIIKQSVEVITSEADSDVRNIFSDAARSALAPLTVVETSEIRDVQISMRGTSFTIDTDSWGRLELSTPLIGQHQAVNCALAIRSLELLPGDLVPTADAVRAGVASVNWPGRLQIERSAGTTWIFDVAHNGAGVEALVSALRTLNLPRPIVLLAGILGDKDWRSMLPPLFDYADEAVLTIPASAPRERRWDPRGVAGEAGGRTHVVEDFESACDVARSLAGEGAVLVTGSFHTVGDALTLLGLAPFGSDP